MSSTNKTSALGLSQWVLSDAFLMEDFNADNAKIDAAVAGVDQKINNGLASAAQNLSAGLAKKAEIVLLRDLSLNGSSTQEFDISVSDIAFGDYLLVVLDFGSIESCAMRLNSSTSASYNSMNGGNTQNALMLVDSGTRVFLCPCKNGSMGLKAFALNSMTFSAGQTSLAASSVTTINLVASANWPFNCLTKLRIWGVK